jgi:hypothetical protein
MFLCDVNKWTRRIFRARFLTNDAFLALLPSTFANPSNSTPPQSLQTQNRAMMSAVSRCKGFYLLLSLAILCNLSHGALPKLPGTALVQRFIKGRQADPRDHGADIASSEEDFHQATAPVLAEDIAEAIKPPRRR